MLTFNEQLQLAEITPLHQVVLDHVRTRLKPSRSMMANYYLEWEKQWLTYKGKRTPDKNDVEAAKQGMPTKMTIPLTRAQVNSFVAFAFMLLRQKDTFYEYSGVSDTDKTWVEDANQIIDRDFNRSKGVRLLWQFLHNVAIFGIGIQKDYWFEKRVHLPTAIDTLDPDGNNKRTWVYRPVTVFAGNEIKNVSPFRFFPDANYSVAEWESGDFAASESEMSRSTLKTMESQGIVHGIDHVRGIRLNGYGNIETDWGRAGMRSTVLDWTKPDQNKHVISVSDCYFVNLVPSELKDASGNALGPENFPIPYIIWVANDQRIIRCEPSGYVHGQLPYSVGLFSPDDNTQLSGGLAEDIDSLQSTISWFLNSRIAAVSRTIDNQFIADPIGINIASIESRSRVILLNRAAARTDVRRYITQVQTQDTTTGHVSDANNLISLMQMVTGVNDNAMGQYNGGRRSATEARSVVQGAAARMKVVIDLLWKMAFQPQSNRLLLNHRQTLSEDDFVKMRGEERRSVYATFHADAADLASSYDFVAYDGSLPSEKGFLAQTMQELLGILLSNPTAAMQFNIDPKKILASMYSLRGVGQLTQFQFDPNDPTAQPNTPQLIADAQAAAQSGQPQLTGGSSAVPAA